MDKRFYLGVFTGMALMALSVLFYLPQISEAIYSIPPTQAWRTIGIDNNPVSSNSTASSVSAINYRDQLYLLTDGSILLNITEYP